MLFSRGIRAGSLLFLAASGAYLLSAQTAEITTKDAPVTFRSGTNLVPVSVVVRDNQGHAVGNLGIDEFQLFDNGKPQMISKFSVEKILKEPEPQQQRPVATAATGETLTEANPDGIPNRFVAYLFDDLHMSLSDLAHTREAAKRQIDSGLQPLSRAAIYTTSGHQIQEFTNDRAKLDATLDAITNGQAAAKNAQRENTCPPVDYYMGDRIYNKHDLNVWKIAAEDALYFCPPSNPPSPPVVQPGDISTCEASGSSDGVCQSVRDAKFAARIAVDAGDRDTEATLAMLRGVVSRMTAVPGQRNVVFISPGFLVLDEKHDEETNIVNRAIKSGVVIGGLDARGLYAQTPGGEASERINANTITEKSSYQSLETIMQTDVVANMADGTGGTFYHGTNDFDGGLARVAAAPDYIYVLSFSPPELKSDGKFHTLKVSLKTIKGVDLQVRKGYYAPMSSGDPADQSRQEIEEAVFSRAEIHDLPAILQTQYFKTDDGNATLSAVAKVDVKKLPFRKEDGRNRDDITVVTGLFDDDGNFISGAQKIVEMRFLDETLEKHAGSGIAVKNSFAVHPGRYVVRLVIRDSEGQLMSAQSSLVEIP